MTTATKQNERELCLMAISGDCVKGGMGNYNSAQSFGPEHYGIVREYIRAQAEYDVSLYLEYPGTDWPILSDARLRNARRALREANIFKHKWHCRTSWMICEIDCASNHAPFKLDTN